MLKIILLSGLLAAGGVNAVPVKSAGRLSVSVNKNAELLYTILNLTEFSRTLRAGRSGVPPAHQAVLRDFSAFKGHPAVAELDKEGRLNWEKGFCYDMFPVFALYFSPVPEGRRLRDYGDAFLARVLNDPPMTRAEKVKYLDTFWAKVMDFYRESHFEADLYNRAGEFETYVNQVRRAAPHFDVVGLLEGYHGVKAFSKYVLVPSPRSLPIPGNYGPSAGDAIYAFLSLSPGIDYSRNFFVKLFMWKTGMSDYFGFDSSREINFLVLHEFNHSFCNPVVDRYGTETDKYSGLLAGMEVSESYNDWRVVMYELLVRAVHARLANKAEGAAAAEIVLKSAERSGIVFVRDFYGELGEYESNRGKYPTLEKFYPRLLARLDAWELVKTPRPFPLNYFMKPRTTLRKKTDPR